MKGMSVELEQPSEGETCAVCLALVNVREPATIRLECGHSFHQHCALTWFRVPRSEGRCPVCRSQPKDATGAVAAEEDVLTVSVTMAGGVLLEEFASPRVMHRILAPWIYSPAAASDPVLRALIDRYMGGRRRHRHRAARDAPGPRPEADRNFQRAARRLLSYLMAGQ